MEVHSPFLQSGMVNGTGFNIFLVLYLLSTERRARPTLLKYNINEYIGARVIVTQLQKRI